MHRGNGLNSRVMRALRQSPYSPIPPTSGLQDAANFGAKAAPVPAMLPPRPSCAVCWLPYPRKTNHGSLVRIDAPILHNRWNVVREREGGAGGGWRLFSDLSGIWHFGANIAEKGRHCLSETSLATFLSAFCERRNTRFPLRSENRSHPPPAPPSLSRTDFPPKTQKTPPPRIPTCVRTVFFLYLYSTLLPISYLKSTTHGTSDSPRQRTGRLALPLGHGFRRR